MKIKSSIFVLVFGLSSCSSMAMRTPPIEINGNTFWYRTTSNTPIFDVITSNQRLGTKYKVASEQIIELMSSICQDFPEFNPKQSLEVYILNDGKYINRYAIFSPPNKIVFYEEGNVFNQNVITLPVGWCSH